MTEGTGGSGPLEAAGSEPALTCPRCGGVLGEQDERLECYLGHVVVLDALLQAKASAVEDALWAAVRALEEKAAVARRLVQRAASHDDLTAADVHRREAVAAERRAGIVRDILCAHEDAGKAHLRAG